MRDKIKDIIENPNLNRTEVIDRLTELFESANTVEPIKDDIPYVPVDKDFVYADKQNNNVEKSDEVIVYDERYSMDDIEEEEPPVPVSSKEIAIDNHNKVITINQYNGEPITQQDLDGWCNCYNFPHQKCDDCKFIFSEYDTNKEL